LGIRPLDGLPLSWDVHHQLARPRLGNRRFETSDDSRNNFVLALITMGEGWHNNHHKFMYACRQGLRWWEVDCTYYVVKVLGWLGIAREIREPKLVVDEAGEPEMAEAVAAKMGLENGICHLGIPT